jgi:hypothetical protein
MVKGWLIVKEPGSYNERRLLVRQAGSEEKVRHVHCDTDPLNDVVVALVVRVNVINDGSDTDLRSDFM